MVIVVILHRFARPLQILLAVSIGSNNIVAMILRVAGRRVQISLFVLFLCLVTVLTYRPAWHGGFIWDDDRYVTNNHLLTASDGLRRIWFSLDAPSQYFPLTYTVLRIERSLWGLNATGYHWVNILLHLANALLVWRLLARLGVPGGWLAATIFAVHPVQVESVAWISELKNVLMALFFLLTLAAWIEYVDQTNGRRLFYMAALLCYSLALFAKSTACTLPAALLLILWLKEKPIGLKQILEIVPFVFMAIAVGLLAIWWEKYHQGTRTLVSLGPVERILIASRAIWFYLSKIFWPSSLVFIYPQWRIDPANPLAYFWLILTAGCAMLIFYLRRFVGRSVEVAALFFFTTLGPLLGFIMLYTFRFTFVADHYQYLACIGPIALFCAGSVTIVRWRESLRWAVQFAAGAILIVLCLMTARQATMYRDLETLWRTTIAKNPGCWMALNNLGVVQLEKGNVDGAIEKYQQCLRLNPEYPEAHYNLGGALLSQGQVDEAIQECELALKLLPNEPDALIVLGNAFFTKKDIDQAIREYGKAASIRPDDSIVHHNLGLAWQQKGETDRATREFEKANELDQSQKR